MYVFQNFSATHILREIKVSESRALKIAILTHLEALNSDFDHILQFLTDFRASETAEMAVFVFLESSKLISRKI